MEYYGTSYWAPTDSLSHHGIKGMKWGVRRYQNADGSLTAAGRRRYGDMEGSAIGGARRALAKVYDVNERYYSKHGNKTMASMNRAAKNDQLKKAAAADAYKKEHGMSIADRAAARALTSANKRLERMGGRRMNATAEAKIKRGELLKRQNRTMVGAVGRTAGRQALIYGATMAGTMTLAGVSAIAMLKSPNLAKGIASVGGRVLSASMAATTVASLAKGYQDIHDINAYNKSTRGK